MATFAVGVSRARRVTKLERSGLGLVAALVLVFVMPKVLGRFRLRLVRTVWRCGRPDELERQYEKQHGDDEPAAHGGGFYSCGLTDLVGVPRNGARSK